MLYPFNKRGFKKLAILYIVAVAPLFLDALPAYGLHSACSIEPYRVSNAPVIASIEIVRLDPFGTSIGDPELTASRATERFLNTTHINTAEGVIRSYLLFAVGDTLSDRTIRDSERILRRVPFLHDALIEISVNNDNKAHVTVITRDNYSMGADYRQTEEGEAEIYLFEKNVGGLGQEIGIGVTTNFIKGERPEIRAGYLINNIGGTLSDLELFAHFTGVGRRHGFNLYRDFAGIDSEYAGSVSLFETISTATLSPGDDPEPLEYSYQDYWLARSFLVDRERSLRVILGMRYIHNNVYKRPDIDPQTFYSMQKHKLFLTSLSFSKQDFFKSNYIFNYGRTEDIPFGMLLSLTGGWEENEFKERYYSGISLSAGGSLNGRGYLNLSASAGAFINQGSTEQGVLEVTSRYFTDLVAAGNWRIRTFAGLSYTRGFNRYSDEHLTAGTGDMVTGFRNDSLSGSHRAVINLESVFFSPLSLYGFETTLFAFSDIAILGRTGFVPVRGSPVGVIGAGIRLHNESLAINTFQIRFGYYPSIPDHSSVNRLSVSGEKLLNPRNFDPGAPDIIVYR